MPALTALLLILLLHRSPLASSEPMPVILGGVGQSHACTPVYSAPSVWLGVEVECVPARDVLLVWRAEVDDQVTPTQQARFWAVNWQGVTGWARIVTPSWAGRKAS